MKVLVGCERTQAVCMAFREMGHEAYSCDIEPCEGDHPEFHIQHDVLEVLEAFHFYTQDRKEHFVNNWDLLIGHPPCTYLSYAGTAHWNAPGRIYKRLAALEFFAQMWEAPIERICLENPKGCASPTIAKYNQIIQPYYFGDPHIKTTCLWLKNLPKLVYTKNNDLFTERSAVDKPEPLSVDGPGSKRAGTQKRYFTDQQWSGFGRSRTFPGIAKAMAEQWGK